MGAVGDARTAQCDRISSPCPVLPPLPAPLPPQTFLEQLKHIYSGSTPPDELKIPPTVGLNLGKLDVNRVRFIFWDLGGQQSLRVLWDKYFAEAHAIVYILDATDTSRLEESAHEIAKVLQDKDLSDAPLVVLANKQDLKHALEVDTLAKLLHLPDTAIAPLAPSAAASSSIASSSASSSTYADHVVRILPISALNGQGIAKAMDFLLEVLPKSRRTQRLNEKL
jgi:ADP-ribosylation factor related protein 1